MKKIGKSLIILSAATMAISLNNFMQSGINIDNKTAQQQIQAYNYNPSNILDNVFTEGNVKYLPFIFTDANQEINVDTLKTEFQRNGLTIKNVSTGTIVGTGTIVTVNENSDVYTVVIYGDTNGDGKVNLIDAQKIVLYKKYPDTYKLEGVYFKAANTSNQDNTLNLIDAQRIVLFKKGTLQKLVVEEQKSDRELDVTKPVITLNGEQTVSIKANTNYVDAGATATDNYDGNITNKINAVSNVNTAVPGTYTVIYNVIDNNGNSANTVTRTVIVEDEISTIEIEAMPKTEYNYGSSKVDLTGATIKVDWLSGKTESKTITESMLSSYDLSSEGEKVITVNYEGFQTTFNVTVLNKIAAIELLEEGRENITTIEGGYKVTTTKEFTLGTLKETQTINTSKLEKSQVSVEVGLVTSEDSTAIAEDLQVTAVDNNGNVLLQGKALKAGNYTIDVFITYGEEKIKLSQIHLTAEKSGVIKEISLEEIKNGEIRYGLTEQVVKQVIVINENGENMQILAKDLEISNVSNDVTITMLDENKDPISDDEIIVKYLEIQTTLTTEQQASFRMKSAEIEKTISFLIGDKLVLADVEISATNIPLYVEGQESSNVVETDGRFYTILPINFSNQLGEKINVPAYNITASITASDFDNIEEGKVGIILPNAMRKVTVGSSPIEKEGNVLDVKFYDESGNEVTGANSVAKIGIALTIEEESIEIYLSTLEGKNIQFVYANQANALELPIEVNYKQLVNLDITTECQDNVTLDGEEYVVDVNEEFVLGTIVSGTYEEPVVESLLNTNVTTTGSQDGIQISYEKDENGNILIKGKATKIGIYQIAPYIEIDGEKVETKQTIIVKSVGLPTVEEIQLSETAVVNGNATIAAITAISDANPTGEVIELQDIKVEAEEGISVAFLDVDEFPIDPTYVSETVSYLEINTSLTETTTKTITITLYEGQTKEYTETITLQVN